MFDSKLADYALNLFKRDGIRVQTQHNIESLHPGLPGKGRQQGDGGCFTLKTKQEGEMGIGMCVWSTGQSLWSSNSEILLKSKRSNDESLHSKCFG